MRRFDRVVAVSGPDESARSSPAAWIRRRVVVIHNAIVTENYAAAASRRGEFRQRYGIPADAPLVGNVGRLSPEKGQCDLLRAAPSVLAAASGHAVRLRRRRPRPARPSSGRPPTPGITDRVVFTGHLTRRASGLSRPRRPRADVAHRGLAERRPRGAVHGDAGARDRRRRDRGDHRGRGRPACWFRPKEPEGIAAGLPRLIGNEDSAGTLALNGKRFVHRNFNFARRVAQGGIALSRDSGPTAAVTPTLCQPR